MSKLNGIKMGAALLMLSSIASAAVVIDNTQIPSEDIVSITISPDSGNMFITTDVGYEVKPVGGPTTGTVAVSSLTASPLSFVAGGKTTVSWVTAYAESCNPTGGTSAWRNTSITRPSGSSDVYIATPGTYAFTLTCTGSSGSTAFRSLDVQVTQEPVVTGTNCSASPLAGSSQSWMNFWKSEFPQPRYSTVTDYYVPKNGYHAYKFNTGNVQGDGSVVSISNTMTAGTRTGSISECPGDFAVVNACKHTWGLGGGIGWTTIGTANNCQLKPNTDYYLNVTFTNGTDSTSSTCSTSNCAATMQHVHR
jgi:hypothetical protein